MTAPLPVAEGKAGLFALPYTVFTGNDALDEARNATVLDSVAGLPNMFPVVSSVEERRLVVAQYLTNPENVCWGIWRGGALCGILLLTRVTPGVDALCHIAFFDKCLWDKQTLLRNMIGVVFRSLALQRLSAEIPSHLEPLIRFARTKLGFRFEGEPTAATHVVTGRLGPLGVNNPARWLAHWGSRREQAHFDGTTWVDVVCLRILREEYNIGRSDT